MKSLQNIINIFKSKLPETPRLSYSYDGEDLLLKKIVNKQNGYYVDIGAHDPIKYSNTYMLYMNGWKGINIDANPLAISKFNKKRKNCTNLNFGVSSIEGKSCFYISENPLLSSFDKTKVQEAKDKWNFNFTEKFIKTYRLETILDDYLYKNTKIDLFNIDVEGMEFDILESNNWDKYSPSIILIELHERYIEDVIKSDIYKFLNDKGYRLVSKTFATLIFEQI